MTTDSDHFGAARAGSVFRSCVGGAAVNTEGRVLSVLLMLTDAARQCDIAGHWPTSARI